MKNAANFGNLGTDERRALMALLAVFRKNFPDNIDHVILFGSKARGDSDGESDIDLLIEVKEYSWSLEGVLKCSNQFLPAISTWH